MFVDISTNMSVFYVSHACPQRAAGTAMTAGHGRQRFIDLVQELLIGWRHAALPPLGRR
jgi:hypothetical protein